MAKVCNITFDPSCIPCKELSQSLSNLTIAAGLAASTAYYIWIIDKFGNISRDQYTTDISGAFTLDPDNYPEGMLNPHAGAFKLFVTMDQAGTIIVPMVFSAVNYDCAWLTINSCS